MKTTATIRNLLIDAFAGKSKAAIVKSYQFIVRRYGMKTLGAAWLELGLPTMGSLGPAPIVAALFTDGRDRKYVNQLAESLKAQPAEPDYDNMSEDELMERCRAARALIESQRSPEHAEELKLYGFLSLFHPELTHAEKLKLCRNE